MRVDEIKDFFTMEEKLHEQELLAELRKSTKDVMSDDDCDNSETEIMHNQLTEKINNLLGGTLYGNQR